MRSPGGRLKGTSDMLRMRSTRILWYGKKDVYYSFENTVKQHYNFRSLFQLEMCPLEHEWPATQKRWRGVTVWLSRNFAIFETFIERGTGCRVCIPSYYTTMNHLYKFRLKKIEAPLRVGFREISRYFMTFIERRTGCRVCIPLYFTTMNHLYKFRLKKIEAPLRVVFREISRYSRHSSSAEPDVGCVYHHTIQRWTIYISSD